MNTPDDDTTTFIKYECDKGNRWTAVKGGVNDDGDSINTCYFSGCQYDHKAHKIGETNDKMEAYNWFRDIYKESEQE